MTAQAYLNVSATPVQNNSAATLTPPLPTSRVSGNAIYAVCVSKNNAVHSTSTAGWVKKDQVNSGASFTASLWECEVDGTEAAPVFTWTGAAACSARVWQYTRDDFSTALTGAFSSNFGTGTTHTSPALTTTANNSRIMYVDVCGANTAASAPSGRTERFDAGNATGATRMVVGDSLVTTAGGSSGSSSLTGGNAAWVQWQVELLEPLFTGDTYAITNTDDDVAKWTPPDTFRANFLGAGTDFYSAVPWICGFRFAGINVPNGADITTALLRVTVLGADENGGSNWGRIYGDLIDNAPAFTITSISAINPTTSSAALRGGTVDSVQFSINVTDLIQEIVSQPGWASGNALRLASNATGANGFVTYYDYSTDPAKAAQLLVEYTTGGGGTTGTASITEGADTAASTATLALKGTASPTEASDTSSATSKIAIASSLAVNEQDDTLSAAGAGLSPIAGAAAITEADDAVAASSAIKLAGALAATEVDDTIAASAKPVIAGALAATEADDTASAAGKVQIQGVGIATEGADTLASTAALALTATAAITEGSDTASGAASLVSKGVLAVTEAADTVSATSVLAIKAQAAITDDDDATVGSSALRIDGVLSITEQGDTLAATSGNYKFGDLAVTEADDALASTGILPIAGAATINEAGDTVASSGALPITATASITEAGDTLAAYAGRSGKLEIVEADDTASASGVFSIRGAAAIVEEMDSAVSSARLFIAGEGAANDNDDWLGALATLGLAGDGAVIEDDDTVEGVVRLGKRLPFTGTARNVTTYMDRSGATIAQPRNGTSPRPRNAATAVTTRNAASVRMPR